MSRIILSDVERKAMARFAASGVGLQDAGTTHHNPGDVPVYHTHGLRQYLGRCKIHKRLDCPHLLRWTPGKGLGKTVMREHESNYNQVPQSWRCRTCFAG